MPTLIELRDDIISIPSGGVMIDDTKYDFPYIEYLLHQYRERAIVTAWSTSKRINPLWTQQFVAEYDEELQESDKYVLFKAPPPIAIDSMMDGFLYIGETDGNCAYTKVVTRADLANRNEHRYSKCEPGDIKVLWNNGVFEVYGNTMLKELRVDGVFADPTLIPTYNMQYDQYPVSNDIIVLMKEMMMKEQVQAMTQTDIESSTDNPRKPNS